MWLHRVTGCYMVLQGVARCYTVLKGYTLVHGVRRCYKVLHLLHGVRRWYMVLPGVTGCYTRCYMVLQVVVWCYTMLKGATRWCMVLHDAKGFSRPSYFFREKPWGRGFTGACVRARVYARVFDIMAFYPSVCNM